ncbi:MAG: segregation and condensation protein B [Saprospiraceae bacterium]|jgi:segregation and condensation protein B
MQHLAQQVEALIFTAEQPITIQEMKTCMELAFEATIKEEDLVAAVTELQERYAQDIYATEILDIAGGFQFMTKPAFHPIIGQYLRQTTKKRLSRAAMETLSIIAYKQPVTKSEMEKIRGVSCDYAVQKLLEKELVDIKGRSDGPGKPLFYGTSERFMDYFGLKNLGELPKPKDFKEPESEIGEKAPIEEVVPVADEAIMPTEADQKEE